VGIRRRVASSTILDTRAHGQEFLSIAEACDFLADPFLFASGGNEYLLTEAKHSADSPGWIRGFRIQEGRAVQWPALDIKAASHLSYPFVFTESDQILVIPESAASSRVEALGLERDGPHWTRRFEMLVNVAVVDPTVLRYKSKYWLFCSPRDATGASSEELWLYSSDRLDGTWDPHPLNPVVADARHARPGGTPFFWQGELFRPAQDASQRYGGGLVLCCIERLSATEYEETPRWRLIPTGRSITGLHTYSLSERFEALDWRVRHWRFLPRRHPPVGARLVAYETQTFLAI
jgi:hypothetical protein